ncbi:uncharacterized protein perm1b [Odontesthes bonariensis]|uniref:uncharacterized protein perm1b n=1 Tax=Odontesthes bonariensis TaxID=219752 RepID=UPI003F583862
MDDLDHSIHIAEYDWSSFCDESEDCSLLQPSLAYPDDSSLSDSEDSGNSSSVFSKDQQETRRSSDADSNTAEQSCSGCARLPEQLNPSGIRETVDDSATSVKQLEMRVSNPGENAIGTEEMGDSSAKTLQTDPLNVQDSEETKEQTEKGDQQTEKGDLQTESDLKSTKEPDPLSCYQAAQSGTEPDNTERAASAVRPEKERWFVTVNDNPRQQRGHSASLKKKRKQKKLCEGSRTCGLEQESSPEEGVEKNDRRESEEERDALSNQTDKSGHPSDEINVAQVVSNLAENLAIPQSLKENFTEALIDEKCQTCESDSSASTPQRTFTPSQLEFQQCDKFEDSAEIFSIHSDDSETYLSASESMEELQHPLQDHLSENPRLQCSLSLPCDSHESSLTGNTDTDPAQERQMHPCGNPPSSDVADTNCEGHKSTSAGPSITLPSAGQGATEIPDDDSTCKNDTDSETPGAQTLPINLSASACSQGDQLAPLPVPDLTVALCRVADSPETYAKAAGHARPVYAISAFWDEMEKMTINDILQLKMGRSSPLKPMQETVTPDADALPTKHDPLTGPVEYNLSDSGLMDTSDTADSDYFTQTDESKPDLSSCEFSNSDLEEEYWQFVSNSRNPSPEGLSKKEQNDTSFLSHEDDSTSSEGRDTPVPLEDFVGQYLDSQENQTLALWPRRMTKSTSMYNVRDFNTFLPTLPGNDGGSLTLSSHLLLDVKTDLIESSSLQTLISASFSNTDLLDPDYYRISFPEMFEYFFTQDKATTESRFFTVYDPEDISVAPVFDFNLCTLKEDASSSSLQRSIGKPIPIFSCSHPTVRELTFPTQNYVLSANCEEVDEISPIRVVSHSFIHAGPHRSSAAAVGGSRSWKSLPSFWKIRFRDKGSIWCRGSGAQMFPAETEEIQIRREAPKVAVLSEGRVCTAYSQVYRELQHQQRILETIQTPKQEGIFSTVKQSDMCLVCIAFASWVLTSSDPEAADAWKAALLANVSALSAIQYLRQYVKKKNRPPDDL